MTISALVLIAPLLLGPPAEHDPIADRAAGASHESLLPGDAACTPFVREMAEDDGEEEDGLPGGPRGPLVWFGPPSRLRDPIRPPHPRAADGGQRPQRAPPVP